MSETKQEQNMAPEPLPEDLQSLVDKEETDKQIRGDFENSWTTTCHETNTLEQTRPERKDCGSSDSSSQDEK